MPPPSSGYGSPAALAHRPLAVDHVRSLAVSEAIPMSTDAQAIRGLVALWHKATASGDGKVVKGSDVDVFLDPR